MLTTTQPCGSCPMELICYPPPPVWNMTQCLWPPHSCRLGLFCGTSTSWLGGGFTRPRTWLGAGVYQAPRCKPSSLVIKKYVVWSSLRQRKHPSRRTECDLFTFKAH